MSIIKPDRDTLFDLTGQCLNSVYLCICLAESSKINSLIPLALAEAKENITKIYDLCKYDYPEELETAYSNILYLDKLAHNSSDLYNDFCIPYMSRMEEIYDALLEIHGQMVETDAKSDDELMHEEFCDLCHLTVDLFNAICLYKVFPAYLYPTKMSASEMAQREKRAFQMARDMKREHLLPKELCCLFSDNQLEDFIEPDSFDGFGYAGRVVNELKTYLIEKLKILNSGCSEGAYDVFNFFIYLSEMEQILAFTFDDSSELFTIRFAPGWEKTGLEALSLIEGIEFHTQADSNDVLVDAWPDKEETLEQEEEQVTSTVGPQTIQITFDKPEYEDKLLYISVNLPHKNFIKEPEKEMGPDYFDKDFPRCFATLGDDVIITADVVFTIPKQDDSDVKNLSPKEEVQQESEVSMKENRKLTDGIFPILRKASANEVEADDFKLQYCLMTEYGKVSITLANFGPGKELKKTLEEALNDDENPYYFAILNNEQYTALEDKEDCIDLSDELQSLKKENENLKRIIDARKRLDQAIENEQSKSEIDKHEGTKVVLTVDASALDQVMQEIETLESHLGKLNEISVTGNIEEIDAVNPKHYHHAGLECIDVMERYMSPEEIYGFCKGCAFKYLWRAGNKAGNSAEQDYQKAKWYLEKADEYEKDLY